MRYKIAKLMTRCLFHKYTTSSPELSLGAPRSSVASRAGLEPGVPRRKALAKDLRNGHLVTLYSTFPPQRLAGLAMIHDTSGYCRDISPPAWAKRACSRGPTDHPTPCQQRRSVSTQMVSHQPCAARPRRSATGTRAAQPGQCRRGVWGADRVSQYDYP